MLCIRGIITSNYNKCRLLLVHFNKLLHVVNLVSLGNLWFDNAHGYTISSSQQLIESHQNLNEKFSISY